MNETANKPVLYLMLCAAPPAQHMHTFLPALQTAGWDVCVIATPQATRWIQIPDLEAITGHMVRTDYKLPGEANPLPKAAAILVMPATFHTINKWGSRNWRYPCLWPSLRMLGTRYASYRCRSVPQDGPCSSSSFLKKYQVITRIWSPHSS